MNRDHDYYRDGSCFDCPYCNPQEESEFKMKPEQAPLLEMSTIHQSVHHMFSDSNDRALVFERTPSGSLVVSLSTETQDGGALVETLAVFMRDKAERLVMWLEKSGYGLAKPQQS